jgi:hypothetical protein
VPDVSANIERAGTIATSFASLAAEAVGRRRVHFNVCVCVIRREEVFGYSHGVECVRLQFPNRPAEETSADKEEEVGHHDEEDCKGGARGKGVDQETAGEATNDAYDGRERNRCGGFAEGDTTHENDGFKTYIVC